MRSPGLPLLLLLVSILVFGSCYAGNNANRTLPVGNGTKATNPIEKLMLTGFAAVRHQSDVVWRARLCGQQRWLCRSPGSKLVSANCFDRSIALLQVAETGVPSKGAWVEMPNAHQGSTPDDVSQTYDSDPVSQSHITAHSNICRDDSLCFSPHPT